MIDINPNRCIRTAEEMSVTKRTLMQVADSLTDACSVLRSSGDDSMQMIARTVDRYISDIQFESRMSDTMSLMLEKIAESYMRAENDTHDFIDQIYTSPVIYGTVMIGEAAEKAKDYFEVF